MPWPSWLARLFGARAQRLPVVSVDSLPSFSAAAGSGVRYRTLDGDKYPGSYGATSLLLADYWTLRARSAELFESNLYGRGIIRRLVTNEINTGLHLEAVPEEKLLGFPEDGLAEWSESVENRFQLWERCRRICDARALQTFGQLQAVTRSEALVSGDVLVVLLQDPVTQLPRVKLVRGEHVQSPLSASVIGALPNGNRISHGVELNDAGGHEAFWIRKPKSGSAIDFTHERVPAYGPKTGRRQAWLVYGTDKRLDDVRGKPILQLILNSLREIDRYRDSVQLKATINAMVAMFIKREKDVLPGKPITGGAVRRGTNETVDNNGEARTYKVAEHVPGLVLENLQPGEEPVGFMPHGVDEKFGDFEDAIVAAMAWALEAPPEIIRLSFNSNYSASQAAINEFKIYLNRVRNDFGCSVCQPIYEEWLVSEALRGKVEAESLLKAWRDPGQFDVFGAWVSAEWAGHIKPAVDVSKLVKGYEAMIAIGAMTRDRAARELTGTKFSKNIARLRIENKQLADANASLTPDAPETAEPVDNVNRDDEDREEEDAAAKAASPLRLLSAGDIE